jgi:hypothetical protein
MLITTNGPSASGSSLNTHVEEPERAIELSRTLTPHAFNEVIDNIHRGQGGKDEEVGDALDGEVNELEAEKSAGLDPFMVVFEPGDPENPKVSRVGRVFIQQVIHGMLSELGKIAAVVAVCSQY